MKNLEVQHQKEVESLLEKFPPPTISEENEIDSFFSKVSFIDIETTALKVSALKMGITAIGVQPYLSNQIASTLINCLDYTRVWDPESEKLTGISKEHLRDQPDFVSVLRWLWHFVTRNGKITHPILIAHNAAFEKEKLQKWFSFFHIDIFDWGTVLFFSK